MGKAEPGNGTICLLSRQIIHVEAEGREMALKGPSHRWGPHLSLYSGAKKIFTYFFSKYLVSAFSGPAVLMLAVQWGGV